MLRICYVAVMLGLARLSTARYYKVKHSPIEVMKNPIMFGEEPMLLSMSLSMPVQEVYYVYSYKSDKKDKKAGKDKEEEHYPKTKKSKKSKKKKSKKSKKSKKKKSPKGDSGSYFGDVYLYQPGDDVYAEDYMYVDGEVLGKGKGKGKGKGVLLVKGVKGKYAPIPPEKRPTKTFAPTTTAMPTTTAYPTPVPKPGKPTKAPKGTKIPKPTKGTTAPGSGDMGASSAPTSNGTPGPFTTAPSTTPPIINGNGTLTRKSQMSTVSSLILFCVF
jgi:hypothetical protein